MEHGRRGEGLLLALSAAALWGFTPVATKGALAGYSPELVSVVRLGLSALLLRRLGGAAGRWLPGDGWSWLAGVALGADFLLYNYGMRLTTAALAGLVINVEVVSGIALARWLLGEPLTARRVAGAAVTLGGLAVVVTDGVRLGDLLVPERWLGNVLVMLAALAWSVFAVAQRKVPRAGNLFRLLVPIFVTAMLTTLPGLLRPSAWHNPGGAEATAMLGVLVLLCTVAVYLLYARSQECLDLTVLTILLSTIPVFAVGFAWAVRGEAVSARLLAGGAVILAGVVLVAAEPARATRGVRPPLAAV